MPASKTSGPKPADVFREALLSRLKIEVPPPDTPQASRLADFIACMNPYYERVPHTELLCDYLEAVERGDIRRLIINIAPRHSKALALDTPVPVPTGWKTMGELCVGDEVFDDIGNPCHITWVSPVWQNRPVYKVITDDGDEIVADKDHQWRARLSGGYPVFKLHTTEVLARKRGKRAMIVRARPLQLPELSLPIAPYTLGLWLGDGTSVRAEMTSSLEDQEFLKAEVNRDGYRATPHVGICGDFRTQLRRFGLLGNKHIPAEYLRSSQQQRMALLQGLIDSDGGISAKGQITYTSVNRNLAEGVQELARSLGVKASFHTRRAWLYDKDCGDYFAVSFYMADAARLPRKNIRCRNGKKTLNAYVRAIPHGMADTVCIEVDSPSHLFLVGRSMTPTHNSFHVSDHLPAFYLGRHPRNKVILASHTAQLAYDSSRRNRDHFKDSLWPFPNAQLHPNVQAATKWETTVGGECFAVGVGGAIPGHGAHVLIIDDPVAGPDEADSPIIREKIWLWYIQAARPRLQPGGCIILMHTRWNEDDLVGRILNTKDGGNWEVLSLETVCTDKEKDPLHREVGEYLWPSWYDADELPHPDKGDIDTRGWLAQYQQAPVHEHGNMFHRDWWERYDLHVLELAGLRASFTTIDSSFKDGVENDFSVMATWGMFEGRAYLMDLWRAQVQYPQLLKASRDVYAKWHVPLIIEDKASGQSLIQSLGQPDRDKPAIPVIAQPIDRNHSKVSRAERITRYVEAKLAYLPEDEPWVGDFIEEHASFPNAKHDDQVDTTSIALRRLFLGATRPEEFADFRYKNQSPLVRVSTWRNRQKVAKQAEAEQYIKYLEERDEMLRLGRK